LSDGFEKARHTQLVQDPQDQSQNRIGAWQTMRRREKTLRPKRWHYLNWTNYYGMRSKAK
jgi:hypothetical protein